MSQLKTAIIVSGMHRSGTSSIAGVLNLLGVRLPADLMPALPENPRGFFESMKVMQLNDRILGRLGMSWSDWRSLPDGWPDGPDMAGYRDEACRIVAAEFGEAALIVLKDPRFSRLLPLWHAALTAAGYRVCTLIPVRDPAEIAESLWARNGIPRQITRLSWARHLLDAEFQSRGWARVFVCWDDFMQDWEGQARRIGARLSIDWPVSFDAARPRVADFLSPGLRHHRAPPEPVPATQVRGEFAQRTYVALLALARDVAPADGDAAFDAIRREFHDAEEALEPVVAGLNGDRHLLAVERDHYRSRVAELEASVPDGTALTAELVRVRVELSAAASDLAAAIAQAAREREDRALHGERLKQEADGLRRRLADAEHRLRVVAGRVGGLQELPLPSRLMAALRRDARYFDRDYPAVGAVGMGAWTADEAQNFRASAAALDLGGLLAVNGDEFLAAAYIRLLGRDPDDSGLSFYRPRLLRGEPKIRILAELAASEEAMARGTSLRGLRAAMAVDRVARLPLLGRVVGLFLRVDGDSKAERRVRAIEQALYLKNH